MANQTTQTALSAGITTIVMGGLYLQNTFSFKVYVFAVLICLLGNLIANLDQDNPNALFSANANLGIVVVIMLTLYLYASFGLLLTLAIAAGIYLLSRYAIPPLLSNPNIRHALHTPPMGLLLLACLIIICQHHFGYTLTITMSYGLAFLYGYLIALILDGISNVDYAQNNTKARWHISFRCYDHIVWWLYSLIYIALFTSLWFLPNFNEMYLTTKSLLSQLNLWW